MSHLDVHRLEKVKARLGEAVLDPRAWPALMDEICEATRTSGAALLQSDVRTPDVPMTDSVRHLFRSYFDNNLHVSDVRAARGVPLLQSGRTAVRDQDLFGSEREMMADPLYAHIARFGFRWWSVVGFRSGPALWGMALQRTFREGAFEEDEMLALASFSESMTEAATLSRAVGRQVLTGSLDAFEMVGEPAVSLAWNGSVVGTNGGAVELFGPDFRVRNGRLFLADRRAAATIERLLARALAHERPTPGERSDYVVARRRGRRSFCIRAVPVRGAAAAPFLGARLILTFRDMDTVRRPPQSLLREMFSLTEAESRAAALLADGSSPERIADELTLSRETVRNQLKSVFAKTGAHRQSELVALLQRLGC